MLGWAIDDEGELLSDGRVRDGVPRQRVPAVGGASLNSLL